jgi:hypothetical protein
VAVAPIDASHPNLTELLRASLQPASPIGSETRQAAVSGAQIS